MWKKSCSVIVAHFTETLMRVQPETQGIRVLSLLTLCLALIIAGGCATRPSAPGPQTGADGRFLLPDGAPLKDSQILEITGKADYILLGERHDNAVDHAAQARFIELVAKNGMTPAIGLEMLPRWRFTEELRAFTHRKTQIDALPDKVDWKRSWGFDFALYEQIFLLAQQYELPIFGLNLPNEIRRDLRLKGLDGLTENERKQLPQRVIPPLEEQKHKLAEVFLMHKAMGEDSSAGRDTDTRSRPVSWRTSGAQGAKTRAGANTPGSSTSPANRYMRIETMPAESAHAVVPPKDQVRFERFLLVQSLWDSIMAEEAVAVRKTSGRPVIILAGSGHVENGWGIERRLKLFDPGARILSILPLTDPPVAIEGKDAGKQRAGRSAVADLFYHSPPASRGGYGMRLAEKDAKLQVVTVFPGSKAESGGLRVGDTLVRAGNFSVTTAKDVHKAALAAKAESKTLTLIVERKGDMISLELE